MSSKNSSNSVKSSRCIWMKNLPSSSKQKRDPRIPFVEKLTNLTRMTTNRQILGNFTFLFNSKKRRLDRIKIMIIDIELQVKSGGKIGYSMVKQAPFESVHPRKRIQLSKTQPLVSSSQLQHTQTHYILRI